MGGDLNNNSEHVTCKVTSVSSITVAMQHPFLLFYQLDEGIIIIFNMLIFEVELTSLSQQSKVEQLDFAHTICLTRTQNTEHHSSLCVSV